MRSSNQKIIRFFPSTDLRSGHDGLAKIADKHDIKVDGLGPGEYLIFTNRKRNALKLYTGNFIVVHQRLPKGSRLDMRVIQLIPKYFNGKEINLTGAMKEVFEKEFGK